MSDGADEPQPQPPAPQPGPTPSAPRDAHGRFAPGVSGNPGGRPRSAAAVTAAARGAAGLAVLTAMRLCSDRRADPKTQLQAAKFLILRGFGTPELARAGDGLARYAGLRRQVLHLLDCFLRDEGGDAT